MFIQDLKNWDGQDLKNWESWTMGNMEDLKLTVSTQLAEGDLQLQHTLHHVQHHSSQSSSENFTDFLFPAPKYESTGTQSSENIYDFIF